MRLASKLEFTIDAGTAAGIVRHATELAGVSRERIGDEVRQMLAHHTRARAVGLLGELRLDGPVLTEACQGGQELRYLSALEPGASVPLALAAWALDRGHPPTGSPEGIARRWRSAMCLSNQEDSALCGYLTLVGELIGEWSGAAVARQKRIAAAHGFHGALRLLGTLEPLLAARIHARREDLAATPSGLNPRPLASGDDLIRSGLSPGPRFKAMLERVYDAQLEDRVVNLEQAVRLAQELAGAKGV